MQTVRLEDGVLHLLMELDGATGQLLQMRRILEISRLLDEIDMMHQVIGMRQVVDSDAVSLRVRELPSGDLACFATTVSLRAEFDSLGRELSHLRSSIERVKAETRQLESKALEQEVQHARALHQLQKAIEE